MTPSAFNIEDFAEARARFVEATVDPNSPFSHKMLKAIKLPRSVLIALMMRDGHMNMPHSTNQLLPLDNVYVI